MVTGLFRNQGLERWANVERGEEDVHEAWDGSMKLDREEIGQVSSRMETPSAFTCQPVSPLVV